MQKTAYEMRISYRISDVCSSDLLIVGHQEAFQHFELLAVLQTDDVIRLYRSADRNRGDWGLLLRLAGLAAAGESVVNRSDQPRNIADFDLVVRHMRRNDVSRQSNEILVAPRFLAHSPAPAYPRIRNDRGGNRLPPELPEPLGEKVKETIPILTFKHRPGH